MNRLQQAIRNAAVDGVIKLPAALNIARQFDEDEAAASALLKLFKQNTGVIIGEQIDEHLAKVEGKFFNRKEYDLADKNGEQ